MLLSLDLPVSVQYFSVFLLTMRREWNGIDGLRLDKFYLLIRRFVYSVFALMKKYRWDSELVGRLVVVLDEKTFGDIDKVQGNGVNCQIASVFFEELKPFLPLKLETLDLLLQPFLNVIKNSPDKVLLGTISSNVFDVLLTNGKKLLEAKRGCAGVDFGDDAEGYGTVALKMGLSCRFFQLGYSPDFSQRNRKLLFGLHEQFLKLEKELESSGIEIPLPAPEDHDDDIEEEVPILVPITVTNPSYNVENCDAAKLLKKSKKLKNKSLIKQDEKSKKIKKKKKDSDPGHSIGETLKEESINSVEAVIFDEESVCDSLEASVSHGSLKKDVTSENISPDKENSDPGHSIGETLKKESINSVEAVMFDDPLLSNLPIQFDKVAAEVGLSEGVENECDSLEASVNHGSLKKDVTTENISPDKENSDPGHSIGETLEEESINSVEAVMFDDLLLSNISIQFDKVAAEVGLSEGVESACDSLEASVNHGSLKKRKRGKAKDGQHSQALEVVYPEDDDGVLTAKSGDKSVKKVRFSMKNNLVWKPHTPLPPQSVRIPPSVTPRGSALKKGLSPGPIVETPSSSNKAKQRSHAVRKIKKKTIRSPSPAAKRVKKLKVSSK
ncbi:hypothetical protein SAY87_026407 [Trapa incisa]|uniref:Uncharacterized protein n=1 Tax=Trapa incisa TaxID=236973 RepID=A0AAN7JKQ0_9MYRT|nr:hypothetical protein SAY87_026407 [Trapa incisa]